MTDIPGFDVEQERDIRIVGPDGTELDVNGLDGEIVEQIMFAASAIGVTDTIQNLFADVRKVFEQRGMLLDFLVAAGYPLEWRDDPTVAPTVPEDLYLNIARRWAKKEGWSLDEAMSRCGWAATEPDEGDELGERGVPGAPDAPPPGHEQGGSQEQTEPPV
jgi:hypothetical protein